MQSSGKASDLVNSIFRILSLDVNSFILYLHLHYVENMHPVSFVLESHFYAIGQRENNFLYIQIEYEVGAFLRAKNAQITKTKWKHIERLITCQQRTRSIVTHIAFS